MSVRRVRRGEWILLVATLLLASSLLLDWFELVDADGGGAVYVLRGYGAASPDTGVSASGGEGWTVLGLPWSVLILLAGVAFVAALVSAARAGSGRRTYGALASLVVGLPLSFVVLVATAVRVLLVPPGIDLSDGTGRSTFDADPTTGSWVGLGALAIGLVGLWVALADDRSSAAESRAVAPPPVRPVPDLRTDPADPAAPPV